MNNHCVNPLYVFRKEPIDILLHIKSFIKHPITEINDIRIKALRETTIGKLVLHQTDINNNSEKYFPTMDNNLLFAFCGGYVLSPDEERFWKNYISNLINEKIKYIKTFNNSDTLLYNLKNWQSRNSWIENIYNQCRYPYLSELETLFEKHLSI
jgi:hypothetical protein